MPLVKNFHVRNAFRIGKNISWRLVRLSVGTLMYFTPIFQTDRRFNNVVKKKHEYILSYLDRIYGEDLKGYRDNSAELEECAERNIWMFWNSGEENLPPIVKLCLDSVRKHSNGAMVHLLTMDTLPDYLDIPDYMMDRYRNGRMTLAFLTDYIRISLLEKYGGLWLDATIFVSQDIPDYVFTQPLYSLHTPYEKTIFVNDNKIHCYVMGGRKGFSFFTYVKKEIEKYWLDHDFMVDYYLLDYTIMHAYRNNDEVRALIDGLSYTPTTLYEIIEKINAPWEGSGLQAVLDENIFSKLNWRIEPKLESSGKETVFAHLGKLN